MWLISKDSILCIHVEHGATSTSSSSLSRAQSIEDLPCFVAESDSERRGKEVLCYSLQDIALALKLNPAALMSKLYEQNINDHVAKECMSAICDSVDANFVVESNMQIEGMGLLSDLCSKSNQRPDIIVYTSASKTKVVMFAEVRSSPMVYMERKATIGAANLLRLLRCTDDKV